MMGAKQLKVGLRVRDLEASRRLYLKIGFREIPNDQEPNLRYLTYGNTWLILSDLNNHGYYNAEEERRVRSGPLGLGVGFGIPTKDLDAMYELWRTEGLPIVLEPEEAGWARVFTGQDLDGYQLMFEQFH
ncbi:VOC family protein [Nocardia sp. XZ_19_385]|uniref:VOC family protein n=1 Tax=Nocardia sp. XZ_19_385 TaxID=2769488 RepID=UPI001E40BE46|nr:VOC family protein [Nocardia sp. XZ_19_385]